LGGRPASTLRRFRARAAPRGAWCSQQMGSHGRTAQRRLSHRSGSFPARWISRDDAMELTSHLSAGDRERVEARLRHNLIAWLTSVKPDGQPVNVPAWFLMREDETILLYSQPGKAKLRNIADNPKVSLALDGTDIGRNI